MVGHCAHDLAPRRLRAPASIGTFLEPIGVAFSQPDSRWIVQCWLGARRSVGSIEDVGEEVSRADPEAFGVSGQA
jgi:hypothetical protein